MKRKGKNSKKKEKKEINGRFTQKLSRHGFFCSGSPRPPYSPSPEPLSSSQKTRTPKLKILGPLCNQTVK